MKRLYSFANSISWMASIVQACNRPLGRRAWICFLLVNILSVQTTTAQVSSLRIGMPSPTAASLGKYGNIPVSLYTGTPNISIPLFEVKGRTLSVPIVLNYHASGVKVEEIAGWVGLGWALEVGGVITRTMRGLPDDSQQGYYETGDQLDGSNWQSPSPPYVDSLKSELADSEPDMFFFNFVGRSGTFVFGPNGVVRTVPYQKLRFNWEFGTGPQYREVTKWTITIEDGTRYIFEEREYTTDRPLTQTIIQSLQKIFVSSWYLTKIESASGDDVITFTYANPAPTVTHKAHTYFESTHFYVGACTFPGYSTVDNEYDIGLKRLQTITSAFQSATFTTSQRNDALHPTTGLPQEYKLDSFTVYANGVVQRKFVFQYHYFNFGQGDLQRLRLDAVKEKSASNDSLPAYKFDYNNSIALPARLSYSIDHWGYYNGKPNADLIPAYDDTSNNIFIPGADREPDSTVVQAGILKKITYPTGGYTEFTYEAHDYGFASTDTVKKDFGPWQAVEVGVNGSSGYQESTADVMIGGLSKTNVRLNVVMNPGDSNGCSLCDYVEVLTGSGQSMGLRYSQSGNYYFVLQPGNYKLKAVAGVTSGSVSASGALNWQEVIAAKTKLAGGLRIKRIKSHDGIDLSKDIIRKYEYKTFSDPARSSGVLVTKPRYDYPVSASGCAHLSLSSMTRIPARHDPRQPHRL